MLRIRLGTLAQWHGPVRGYFGPAGDESLFAALRTMAMDRDAMEAEWFDRRVYLARYLRQPLSEIDKLTTPESRRYCKAVSELVSREQTVGEKE